MRGLEVKIEVYGFDTKLDEIFHYRDIELGPLQEGHLARLGQRLRQGAALEGLVGQLERVIGIQRQQVQIELAYRRREAVRIVPLPGIAVA